MKRINQITGLFLAAFTLFASAPASAQTGQEPVKIFVSDAKTTHHLNLYVAKYKGFFTELGLDVTIVPVVDAAASRDLVVSGAADIFLTCPTAAISAAANGAPICLIAQVKKPCTSVLVVPQGSPIRSYYDLIGKKIAGISPTCEAVISYTRKVREAGGSFNLEKLAGGPAIAALEAGKVDGAILEEPHVSIAELKGFKVILKDASSNIPCRTINARKAFVAQNPEAAKKFVQAIEKANALILSNPTAPEILTIAQQFTGAPKDAIAHGNGRLKFQSNLDRTGLSALADELVAIGTIKENPGDKLYAEEFKGITW